MSLRPAAPSLAVLLAAAATPPAGAAPLDLLRCYQEALRASERVGIAREVRDQAAFQKDRAVSLVMPKATAKYSYFRQEDLPSFGSQTGGTGGGSRFDAGRFSPQERREAWLLVEQPIFSGLRDRIARRQAGEVIASRSASLAQAKLDLFAGVADAFYGALSAESSLRTLESSVALQRERLREIQARQAVGLARKTEVLLVETQLAGDEANLVRARNDVESARAALGFLLGRPAVEPLEDSFAATEPAPPLEELSAAAQAGRLDLAAAEADVRAAAQAVKLIEREAYPLVKGEGNYYGRREGFLDGVDWDLTVTADLPFFTGGERKARAAEASSRLRQAELVRDQLRRSITVEVTQAWLELRSLEGLAESLDAEVRSAEENHRLLLEEYRQGLATNLEVQTARDILQQASLQRERETYDRKAAWVSLHAAAGSIPGVSLE